MFKKIADNREQDSLATRYRKRRFAFFSTLLSRLERPLSILDIGGTENFWKLMLEDKQDQIAITLLNLKQEAVTYPNMTSMAGDARGIQAEDNCFDVVFSNSVIEHVGDVYDQSRMAKEVVRLGTRYFIQTPNKYFPLEPHFLFPFFQFLPIGVRVRLLQGFNLGWIRRTPDVMEAREIVESIRLLDKKDFSRLFPSASIYEEKALGLTKSFIAYAGWEE